MEIEARTWEQAGYIEENELFDFGAEYLPS
jgi:hypothetical protein